MKRELNDYLFDEFGVDGDRSGVSETWPFVLTEVASIDGAHFFEFESDGAPYYAIYGDSLRIISRDGTLAEIKLQERGAKWIGSRGPIDLNTSRGEHPVIPLIPQRRARIEELAHELRAANEVKILEGLFLERTKEYLALVGFSGEDLVHVIGDNIRITDIPTSTLSSWKVLSRAIGAYIERSS